MPVPIMIEKSALSAFVLENSPWKEELVSGDGNIKIVFEEDISLQVLWHVSTTPTTRDLSVDPRPALGSEEYYALSFSLSLLSKKKGPCAGAGAGGSS